MKAQDNIMQCYGIVYANTAGRPILQLTAVLIDCRPIFINPVETGMQSFAPDSTGSRENPRNGHSTGIRPSTKTWHGPRCVLDVMPQTIRGLGECDVLYQGVENYALELP